MKNIKIDSVKNQSGAVLIVSLILLLVMTIAGITTMSGSTLQERMAGNARQKSIAKINSEAALRSAENYLSNLNILTGANVNAALDGAGTAGNAGYKLLAISSGDVIESFPPDFVVNDGDTWLVEGDAASFEPTDITIPAPGANPPRYIIEYIGRYLEGDARDTDTVVEVGTGKKKAESTAFAFRITSIGWGQDPNVYSILQSIFITAQG